MTSTLRRHVSMRTLLSLVALGAMALPAVPGAQGSGAPKYKFDPDWPKPLPNKWKLGGITGLAVDKDDNVWVLNRPGDLRDLELHAELNPPTADCCVRPPSMIHIDKNGNVIGSFDASIGHGMDVDSKGFVYIGQDTVRKYDPKTGKQVGMVARVPEQEPGSGGGTAGNAPDAAPARVPGRGTAGPIGTFPPPPATGRAPVDLAARAAARVAFRTKYPPTTPMIVGGIEEIRTDDAVNEIYVADNAFGGRVMVFSLDKFEFKRGWGAYGHKLSEISTKPEDHAYTPNGPMAKEFVGHLTFNFSNDGLVYAADRTGNRIHVTDKQGNFKQEFKLAEGTGVGGSTGGVMFSNDKDQKLLYVSDLTNNHIWFLDRKTGKVVGTLGQQGENGGSFFGVHMEATDSRGNLYTGEVFAGERVQRFVPADSPRGKLLEQLSRVQ
jgi:hypothetical protein